ncbi:MAG: sugar phosphate isomerase/epimerase [Candidatus Hydrogenedentes bacterium]|nr:sugar phosphate isomerase/epimerase [Candidatus Hydrogenedentota bacterium]
MRITRRQLLGAATAGLAAGAARAAVAPSAPANGPGTIASQLKLSCAAYSFRQSLPQGDKAGSMTLHDFFELAAVWRLDAVEPTSYYFSSEDNAYLHSLKAKAFNLGLDVSGTAIRNNFCLPPGDARDKEMAHVRKWIDHSVEFGAPCIRVFAGSAFKDAGREQDFAWTCDCLRACCDYAGSRGVFLAIENHGYLTDTGPDVLRIVEAVGHEWCGVNLDTGNFREAPYEHIALVAPKAITVQVKIEVRTADGKGREPADFARIVQILRDVNYRGYVALEYEGKDDPMEAVPRYLEALRKAIAS